MKERNTGLKVILTAVSMAAITSPVQALASEIEELRNLRDSTVTLMNLMVKKGLLSKEDVEPIVEQAKRAEQASKQELAKVNTGNLDETPATNKPNVIRVPLVPEFMRDEMRDEIKQEVLKQAKEERWGDPGALPDWLNRISFEGDIRLRYQNDSFPDDNQPNASAVQFQSLGQIVNNTDETRSDQRIRVRLAMNANISEQLKASIRLITGGIGNGSDPNQVNQVLGNYNSRYEIGIDRAFINYKPNQYIEVNAGRIANPFFTPTELVWSDKISLQGAAVTLTPPATKRIKPFITVGAFPIESVAETPASDAKSKWLFGYQAGINWDVAPDYTLKLGVSYYDYKNVEGIPNATLADVSAGKYNATGPSFRQKGNTIFDINQVDPTAPYVGGVLSQFQELNLSGALNIANVASKQVRIEGDFVRNIGYNKQEILSRTGINSQKEIDGYQLMFTVGDPVVAKYGQWQAFTGYRYLEANAVLDAFTDNNFHMGGTNAKGYFLGGRFGFDKSSAISASWLSSKEVSGLPLAIDTFLLDFITSF